MGRKNYATFISLPGNEVSTQTMIGAKRGAIEADANIIYFPMGLMGVDHIDLDEVATFRYQYNTLTAFLSSDSLDGGIIEYGMITSPISEDEKIDFLKQTGKYPVVLLAEGSEGYTDISFDNMSGFRDSINYLIEVQGCKSIGYVSGPMINRDARERYDTFCSIIKAHGLPLDESYISYGDFSERSKDNTLEILNNHPEIEAIVYANDIMAIGSYNILNKKGYEIGKDIFISAFDNLSLCIVKNPALASVMADSSELAYQGIKSLTNGNFNNIKVPTRFVPRASCGYKNNSADVETTAIETEFKSTFSDIKKSVENNRLYFDELDILTRELIYHVDESKEWMDDILSSFDRLGCNRTFIFQFNEKYIEHNVTDRFKLPDLIELSAYSDATGHHVYKAGKRLYNPLDIFDDEIIQSDKRFEMVIVPLFFREKIMGYIFADCPINIIQYVYQMATQISNTIHMLHIQNENTRINRELLEATNAKNRFLANMSHEIRTPINAIVGLNEMISRECNDGNIIDYSVMIKKASESLLSMVDRLLDISRINNSDEIDEAIQKLVSNVQESTLSRKKYVPDFTTRDARILLVDDNSTNRLVVKKLLSKTGIEIDEAVDGKHCLKRFDKKNYDIILLDHMMPVMDGIETVKILKTLDKYKKEHPFVVALTANAIEGAREEYIKAGFDFYMTKPVVPAILNELIMNHLPKEKVLLKDFAR